MAVVEAEAGEALVDEGMGERLIELVAWPQDLVRAAHRAVAVDDRARLALGNIEQGPDLATTGLQQQLERVATFQGAGGYVADAEGEIVAVAGGGGRIGHRGSLGEGSEGASTSR